MSLLVVSLKTKFVSEFEAVNEEQRPWEHYMDGQ